MEFHSIKYKIFIKEGIKNNFKQTPCVKESTGFTCYQRIKPKNTKVLKGRQAPKVSDIINYQVKVGVFDLTLLLKMKGLIC